MPSDCYRRFPTSCRSRCSAAAVQRLTSWRFVLPVPQPGLPASSWLSRLITGRHALLSNCRPRTTRANCGPTILRWSRHPTPTAGSTQGEGAGAAYAAHVAEAVEALAKKGVRPAAFVIDTIASSSGVVAPPSGYLKQAAEIVRCAGGLFVADEVQPGFGRTGRSFWGFSADDVVPDIVTLGKPMGNGYPLAATVVRRPLAEAFASRFGYFNTFGGNPVAAAAGLAVLEVLQQEGLQDNALNVGRYLKDALKQRANEFDAIGDVRGEGLFLAVDLVTDRQTKSPATDAARRVVDSLRSQGVLTNTIGPDANILKLRPPMTFSVENADFFLERFDNALAELQRGPL